jgi:Ca2+-dependent lipid-binding protein
MWIAFLAIALMFLLMGIAFINGKGAFLIAGYNTSSKEKKEKYDEKALCKFMGKIVFSFTACFLIMAISYAIIGEVLLWTGVTLFFVIAVFALIYSNTNNRFKKQ